MPMTCGEATIRLLEKYGIEWAFGIPGVHTLDLYRGFSVSTLRHVQVRHEQGAGFMADGYARVTGKPAVALVISGPGVTNALTAVGQAYADSVPLLLISADAASNSLGKGWGSLHEVPDLTAVTRPLTAMSATALRPEDVPELLAQAFSVFASERPRPVHIAIPLDVQAMRVEEDWEPCIPPGRPLANVEAVDEASQLLAKARRPLICLGGGAVSASDELCALVERLGAAAVASNAGKGIIPDSSPASLGASTVRPEVQQFIAKADVVLAVGTELSETDSFVDRLDIRGKLIRIDIDPRKINDLYPADVGIVADAKPAVSAILQKLQASGGAGGVIPELKDEVAEIKAKTSASLSESERRHVRALEIIRAVLPGDGVVMGDACQLAYTGAFSFPVEAPRQWHYAAGYCTLGPALPTAIGAKLALGRRSVVVLAGDGGFMFTSQELVTAAELGISLPIVVWSNGGLKQIQDDMKSRDIPLFGVEGRNPDFPALAEACGCFGRRASSAEDFARFLSEALSADRPMLIELDESDPWLSA
ncbi:MAG: 5-guanidino-2-oxopentanoate decarboxylase [Kiloniellales bacterium]|nr:5-guanidino-2-oxopentanoate decarboxylase [Kiloniellales bacterium]